MRVHHDRNKLLPRRWSHRERFQLAALSVVLLVSRARVCERRSSSASLDRALETAAHEIPLEDEEEHGDGDRRVRLGASGIPQVIGLPPNISIRG